MQLHLVNIEGEEQVLPIAFTFSIKHDSSDHHRVLADARVRLERLNLPDTAAQLYLLQETPDIYGKRHYTLFAVPTPAIPDCDRMYISKDKERYWAKGDEDGKRRLYLLTKNVFTPTLGTFGIGEAAGERIFSSMFLDVIANAWR